MSFSAYLRETKDITQYEKAIKQMLNTSNIQILGMLPLNKQDLMSLMECVKVLLMNGQSQSISNIIKTAPLCLALFLVWCGILSYNNGEYWISVQKHLGIDENRFKTIQRILGKSFIRTINSISSLSKCNFRNIKDDSGYKYVMPILFQGGIPNSCMSEFFSELVWKKFFKMNTCGIEKINDLLEQWQNAYKKVEEQSEYLFKMDSAIKQHEDFLKTCELYLENVEVLKNTSLIKKIAKLKDIIYEEQTLTEEREAIFQKLIDAQKDLLLFSDMDKYVINYDMSFAKYRKHYAKLLLSIRNSKSKAYIFIEDKEKIAKCFKAKITNLIWYKSIFTILGGISFIGCIITLSFLINSTLLIAGISITSLVFFVLIQLEFKKHINHLKTQLDGKQTELKLKEQEELSKLVKDIERFTNNISENEIFDEIVKMLDGVLLKLKSNNDQHSTFSQFWPAILSDTLKIVSKKTREWKDRTKKAKMHQDSFQKANMQTSHIESQLKMIDNQLNEFIVKHNIFVEDCKNVVSFSSEDDKINSLTVILDKLVSEKDNRLKALKELNRKLLKHKFVDKVTPHIIQQQHILYLERLKKLKFERLTLASIEQLPLTLLDRPIQRFILYAHELSGKLIYDTLKLLDNACNQGKPAQPENWLNIFRYEVIYESFMIWWDKHGQFLSIKKPLKLKPLLVCWKEQGDWIVGIKLPDTFNSISTLLISQNGLMLEESNKKGRWKLKKLSGQVSVQWIEDGVQNYLSLDVDMYRQSESNCFVFCGWQGNVKNLPIIKNINVVKKFVACVPDECVYLFEDKGVQEYVAEPLGYKMYLMENNSRSTPAFVIDGHMLQVDADSEYGPIYVGNAPILRCIDHTIHDKISNAILITPVNEIRITENLFSKRIDLPLDASSGCYEFIAYDLTSNELARIPFRYIKNLKDIVIDPIGFSIFPKTSTNGHDCVSITFSAEKKCELVQILPDKTKIDKFKIEFIRKVYKLPAQFSWDFTRWQLSDPNGWSVPVDINIQRCWWALVNEKDLQCDFKWVSSILELKNECMLPTSDKLIFIHHPGNLFDNMVQIILEGFEPRVLHARKGLVKIPLREFFDASAKFSQRDLSLTIRFYGSNSKHAAGQIAVLCSKKEITCEACQLKSESNNLINLTRNCSTCSLCKRYKEAVYCTHSEWRVNSEFDFISRFQTYVCNFWQGEYAGQPFEPEDHAFLLNKHVYIKKWARNLSDFPKKGMISTFKQNMVQINGELNKGIRIELFLCKFDFDKYYDMSS